MRDTPTSPDTPSREELAALRAVVEGTDKQLLESEEEYRDLFEEAPIGYVKEDLESRLITANRAAVRILGLKPEEVAGTVGMSLVPDTPDAQRRAREALASVRRGTDTSGVVLELRRKDNGCPVWVQWWSRPEPNGKYTRTMIVDITERVLMEQEKARLQQQNLYLQEEIKSVHNFEEIIGQSPALTAVLNNIRSVAATDSTVLITGETGTGKELIARAVHSSSRRKEKPLIKINCAALPAGLVESELFGHEKGAFTGAIARRVGRFELADGGTLFLDEIGELPADAQAKLLRVLQEREFDRVGGTAPIQVDVRVLAASNRDLLQMVREKTFRDDLYYRLSVFPLLLPPLRDRKGDIPPLALFLVNKFAARIGKRIDGIDQETMRRLIAYPWPGNVRELENVIERAVILAAGPTLEIRADVLPGNVEPPACEAHIPEQPATLEATEREHILNVLGQTGWVVQGSRGAAKILGLHPNTLRSRMKKLGICRAPHDIS
jgi:PAS domain S-box-containing protein